MNNNNLSASSFADKIGVPRSGLSHVLKGRNNPSLDYIIKIIDSFPQVDIMWLLTGKYQKEASNSMRKDDDSLIVDKIVNDEPPLKVAFDNVNIKEEDMPEYHAKLSNAKKTERIVIFYNDGSFKEYINS